MKHIDRQHPHPVSATRGGTPGRFDLVIEGAGTVVLPLHEPDAEALYGLLTGRSLRASPIDRPGLTSADMPSLLAQLTQLGELRDKGVIDSEEFEALKREMLAGTSSREDRPRQREADAAARAGVCEWGGPVIQVTLEAREPSTWSDLMEGTLVENRWAALGMESDLAGKLQLTVKVWGQLVGVLPSIALPDHPDLIEAVGQGVNVAVVKMDRSGVGSATLFMGRGFSDRPRPPWE